MTNIPITVAISNKAIMKVIITFIISPLKKINHSNKKSYVSIAIKIFT